MMAALLAGVKAPKPSPINPSSISKGNKGSWANAIKTPPPALTSIPAVVTRLAPNRSARRPPKGAMTPRAAGRTMSSNPASPGLTWGPSCRKKGTTKSTPKRRLWLAAPTRKVS